MFTLPVLNAAGKELEKISLDEKIFNDKINLSSVYQVVNQFRANQRKGLASTKTRGEVSGGGKKPWKQKGTGRARVGSTRSPLWRHGGVVFGPHPRDFSYNLQAPIKAAALRNAFCAKLLNEQVTVIDDLSIAEGKTKALVSVLKNLKADAAQGRVLVIVDKIPAVLKQAAANIKTLVLEPAAAANTYTMMTARRVIITKAALKELTKKVK